MAQDALTTLTTRQIADLVGGALKGPEDLKITGVERVEEAGPLQLAPIAEAGYVEAWTASRASAALAARELSLEPGDGRAVVEVEELEPALIQVLHAFQPVVALPEVGIHPSAVVDPGATVAPTARIGPLCIIGPDTVIGADVVMHAGVTVLDHCSVGSASVLWPGVVVRERCTLGERCILHPNVTIGADGFGYIPSPDGRSMQKVPQIGTVVVGDDVEIGASTCVDRGKFSATLIGDGTKIDNLVQIAHNCRIGRSVVICGGCGIAGSVTVGDGAVLGGNVGIKDHLTIGAGANIGGYSAVLSDVPPGATWVGYPAADAAEAKRRYVAMRHLPELVRRMKRE